MVSAWQADTKDTLPADTIDIFCSSVRLWGDVEYIGISLDIVGNDRVY
jgi:hypothetical protein